MKLKFLKFEKASNTEILLPIIILFLVQIIIWNIPYEFIPDIFGLNSFSNVHEQFDIIIGSLVSLIGVYISVTLVAFEFFKQTSGINVYDSILSSRSNTLFISFTISTIIISFTNSILIKNPITSSPELTSLYFNFVLYIVVITSLFPIAFQTFTKLKSVNFIQTYIDQLDTPSLSNISYPSSEFKTSLEHFDKDPLLNIRTILLNIISNNQLTKGSVALDETSIKLFEIIIKNNNTITRNILIQRLISFQLAIVDNCLSNTNRDSVLKNIWNTNYHLYSKLNENNKPADILSKYREDFFERYYQRLFKHDKEEVILFSIKVVGSIIKDQIISPQLKDENLWVLSHLRRSIDKDFEFTNENKDESKLDFENRQFQEIAIEFLNIFSIIIQKAIHNSNSAILNKCFKELNDINFRFQLEGLPKYQAYFFKIRIARLILDYAYDAYEQNVFNKGYDATFLLPSLFKSEIHNDVLTSREIIKQYCLYVLKLQLIDKIDRYHLGGIDFNGLFVTKGSLGDLAQYCLKYLDTQEISYLSLIDILDTFKLLRKRIKKKKDKDSKAYIQLINSRLEELKQEIKTTGNNSKDILKRINQQLKKFKTKKGSI